VVGPQLQGPVDAEQRLRVLASPSKALPDPGAPERAWCAAKRPIEVRQGLRRPAQRGQRVAATEEGERIIGRQLERSLVARQRLGRPVERQISVSLVRDCDRLMGIRGQRFGDPGEPRLRPACLSLGHAQQVQGIGVARLGL